MVARRQTAVYHKIKKANRRGIALDYKTREILLRNSKKDLLEDWKRTVERMREGDFGARIKKALMPAFDEWYGRKHRRVTFHMTQVLSGHGCFISFSYKIKKVVTVAAQLVYETVAPSDGERINACGQIARRSPGLYERDLSIKCRWKI
jgi:hypothetical protein